MKTLRHAVILVVAAAFAYVLAMGADRPDRIARRAPLAPSFVLPDLDGKSVGLASFRGRPVLINFWATWCEPCRVELPLLRALSIDESGCLAVVGVALNSGTTEQVNRFARAHELAYPILMGNPEIVSSYGVNTIPRSVLIDPAGVEIRAWEGPISRGQVLAALRLIAPLPSRC